MGRHTCEELYKLAGCWQEKPCRPTACRDLKPRCRVTAAQRTGCDGLQPGPPVLSTVQTRRRRQGALLQLWNCAGAEPLSCAA